MWRRRELRELWTQDRLGPIPENFVVESSCESCLAARNLPLSKGTRGLSGNPIGQILEKPGRLDSPAVVTHDLLDLNGNGIEGDVTPVGHHKPGELAFPFGTGLDPTIGGFFLYILRDWENTIRSSP